MAEDRVIQIRVRASDLETLDRVADRERRPADLQAARFVDEALKRERGGEIQRGPGRRANGVPRNGVHTAQPATAG